MKKTISLTSIVCMGLYLVTLSGNAGTANAASVTANLAVNGTISMNCTSPVTMGAITGTGKSNLSTNSTTCTPITNNSAGYKLEWTAGVANMVNANSDTIVPYGPATGNTPEVWSVVGTVSEWGARLSSTSTTSETEWGTDDQSGTNYGSTSKWLNIATSARQIADRTTETAPAGDTEVINFGSEVGAAKQQPTGTYTVNVTFTATAL